MSDYDVFASAFRAGGSAHTPGVVPAALCDSLVAAWHAEVADYTGSLKRQHSLQEEVHERSSDGFVLNPLFEPHRMEAFPGFSAAARELVQDTPVHALAAAVLGESAEWLQSAFFESSIGTMPHRDDPPVHPDQPMIGAWIALEDIVVEAGPFILWPGSHLWVDEELDRLGREIRSRLVAGDTDVSEESAAYHAHLQGTLAQNNSVVCAVPKGDVVWWDRRVVHGSLSPVIGAGRSRLSLVVHFVEGEDRGAGSE